MIEQETQDKFIEYDKEFLRIKQKEQALEDDPDNDRPLTLKEEVEKNNAYAKGKILEYARRLDKLDMITEPVKALVKECSRNTDDLKLKADYAAF